MKISEHEMKRRAVVARVKGAILDAIEKVLSSDDPTYAEVIHALQEVQSRFTDSLVVNEWREPAKPS